MVNAIDKHGLKVLEALSVTVVNNGSSFTGSKIFIAWLTWVSALASTLCKWAEDG